jgi:predicted O-linked N-acetylglucosamine transferase (SPINDLY family)
VTLDPFPFGGGVTLSDSIHCGVPFVTLPERQEVHRIGNGLAENMNLTAVMTAEDLNHYVSQAIAVASLSHSERSLLQKHIRSTTTDLFQSSQVNEEWRVLFRQLGRMTRLTLSV